MVCHSSNHPIVVVNKYIAVVSLLLGRCQDVVRQFSGRFHAVVRLLSGNGQAVVKQLSGSLHAVIKLLNVVIKEL